VIEVSSGRKSIRTYSVKMDISLWRLAMRQMVVIPARGGSKGVPGKNMKLLGGKPLIWYTIEKAKYIERMYNIPWIVSTDCPITYSYALMLGATISKPRPASLSKSATSTAKSILFHIETEDIARNVDLLTILQPTTPFTTAVELNAAIELASKHMDHCYRSGLVTVRSVPTHLNAYWQYEYSEHSKLIISLITDAKKTPISRRQDLPSTFYRCGSLYITSPRLIQEGKILGNKPIGICVDGMSYNVNIDTLADWKEASEYVRNFRFDNR
jgi:CMP-N,N'-diacetyllegionaminic acid synthase